MKPTDPAFDPKSMVVPWDQRNVRYLHASRRHVDSRLGHREPCIDIGYMGYVGQNGHGLDARLFFKVTYGEANF